MGRFHGWDFPAVAECEQEPEGDPELDALVAALSEVRLRGLGAVLCGPIEHGECDCCWEMVPLDELSDLIAYGIETTACASCRGIES